MARTKPMPVAYMREEVAILADLGMSTRCIVRKLKLTQCQVAYRVADTGVSRKAYRDGVSDTSKRLMDQALGIRRPPLE